MIDMQLLCELEKHRNLTRASEVVRLSGGADSSRIRKIEEQLGLPITHRTAQGLVLTQVGKRVVKMAHAMVDLLGELEKDIEPYARLQSGIIRVVANYGASVDFLPKAIAAYLKNNPNQHINLDRRCSGDVIELVAQERADFGVCVPVEGYAHPDLTFIPYKKDRLVLVVTPDHPLALHKSVSMEQTSPYEFVCLTSSNPMQRYVNTKVYQMGLKMRRRIEADDQQVLMQFVKSGMGIGVLSYSSAVVDPVGIKVVEITNDWARRSLQIVMRKDPATTSDHARRFIEFLTKNADV